MTFYISIGRRLDSFGLDKFIAGSLSVLFFLPLLLLGQSFDGFWFYFALIGIALALCKDVIDGRSPSKRIFNLQVVDVKTNKAASPLKCFVRNAFFIFPVDLIILLVNQSNRRIGDWIAGTRVVFIDPYEHIDSKVSTSQLILVFAVSYGFVLFISFGLIYIFQ